MTATAARASIVIPAHNEAAVIGRCLSELAAAAELGEIEVVVACNGCSDDTAAIARRFARVDVIELTEPSKTAALNAGDGAVTALPRIYLDADVVVTMAAVDAIIAELDSDRARAARPPIAYDTDRSSWPVRRYYAARNRMPSVMNAMWGGGVYALNRAARARFDRFPEVVADDLWVDGLFARSEVAVVDTDPVVVRVPTRSADLLRVLRRAQLGKRAIGTAPTDSGSADPATAATTSTTAGTTAAAASELRQLARTGPNAAVSAVMYAAFAVIARIRPSRPNQRWERDESSRAG